MDFLRAKALLVLAAATLGGNAAASDFWLGAKVGTLGFGLEGTWRPIRWLDVRVGGNAFSYSDSGSQVGINYDADLTLNTYYISGNLRFPVSPFRLTAGVYSNQNKIEMISTDAPTFDVGGTVFTAADVGTLKADTTFDSTSPYVGAGFDFTVLGKLGLNLDFGVLLQGDPKVTLTSDGLLAGDPVFEQQLEIERQELEDKADALKAYPVVSLGFNLNF